MQVSAVWRAEKTARSAIAHFFFHQKTREFVANSPRGRHALHRKSGRRRCENMLTLKNF